MKLIDLIGQKFNSLTVLSKHPAKGQAQWLCLCDCGATKIAKSHSLRNGIAKSCGCQKETNVIDLIGHQYGRLTVISRAENAGSGITSKAKWNCICECGKTVTCYSSALRGGLTKSCGCYRSEVSTELAGPLNRTHGKSQTRAFQRWISIRQRCFNPNRKDWPRYGGRGITICERWMDFENFYQDMGDPPFGLQIELIYNDGNYEPGNCKWATTKEQGRNKVTSRIIVAAGERMTLAAWAEKIGAADTTVSDRIDRGWDVTSAVTIPPRAYHRRKVGAA